MRYYRVTHLAEPMGKSWVQARRDRFIREAVAAYRAFKPRPETGAVRYVAPGQNFKDCEHAPSQALDEPGCEAAHVYASVEGTPPPRLARKLPKAKGVHRVPQRVPPIVLPADIREALV